MATRLRSPESLPERLRNLASWPTAPWSTIIAVLNEAAERLESLTEGRDCVRAAMQGYRDRALDAEQRVCELEDECRGLREKYAVAVERAWPEDDSNGACEALGARLGIPELREELRDVAAWIAGDEVVNAPSTAPTLLNQIPEAARTRLGRVIRSIVDAELRYGDGSGEADAREAFDALADKLDPDHAAAIADAQALQKGAS